jgi:hypothetical protein
MPVPMETSGLVGSVCPRARLVVAALAVASAVAACQSAAVKTTGAPGPGGTGGGGGGGSLSADAGVSLPDLPPASSDAPVGSPGAPCQPTSCTPPGGKYCGSVGNGCGKTIDCGMDCPAGLTCGGGGVKNLCGAPRNPDCMPISCSQAGGRLCGRVGDGCGGALDCPACQAGETCGAALPNVCGTGSGTAPAVCDNLCKQQVMCAPGQETTLTGTVLAPTPPQFGKADPLYNALVYVPNAPLAPFPPGVACDLCGTPVSGAPLVTALTGPDGTFTLKNVPAGHDIPLVIQIGRWRREVKIPTVTACTRAALPAESTRLPRNRGEGNIPQMAIATGLYDPFECVLRKVGVDPAEFTPPTGPGRIHVYRYEGGRLAQPVPAGGQLVGGTGAALDRYDMVLLPCNDEDQKLAAELGNLRNYTGKGGRLFLTDFSYSWLKDAGPFEAQANWLLDPLYIGDSFDATVDQTFPKGQAFAEWLKVVGASSTLGRLPIVDPFGGASYSDRVVAPAQRWLHTEPPLDRTVQHFTFNTPVGTPADKQCGRVVFSTFHVAEEGVGATFPQYCPPTPMTPQEKALEFMLFDASACLSPDTERPRVFEPPPPAPPPPPPAID